MVNRQRAHPVDRAGLEAFVRRLVREVPPGACDRVAVALVSDDRMRRLNREFAGRDRTTDVLAFPAGDDPLPEGGRHLGDVVVSVPRAAAQARDAGHDLDREIRILVVHGYLHLLGHDHDNDDGRMMRLQSRVVRKLLPRRRAGTP